MFRFSLKKASLLIFCLIGALFLVRCSIKKNNDSTYFFVPGEKWLDTEGVHINAHGGGVLFYKGRYYWYGEYKTSGRAGNTSLFGVSCYSSKDLYHWKNEGIVLNVKEDTNSEITRGCVMERPKVVFNKKTGKYVMWFHLELKNKGYEAARTGVAVSDSPLGPFEYIKSYRPNAGGWPLDFKDESKRMTEKDKILEYWTDEWRESVKNGLFVRRDFDKGQMTRDMTLFVDTDGKAYHIHAAEDNLTLHISELTDDYLDFTNKWITVAPAGHNEAPAIFKQDNVYYMITSGCTGWEPNAARSFKSKSIWGPWEYLGNPCVGENANRTFDSQSTFILPLQGKADSFIFMADRWKPKDPIDGRYVWLPIEIKEGKPVLKWYDKWNLDFFRKKTIKNRQKNTILNVENNKAVF